MGARPSSFKKGGGRLNGVDGVITGYEFTTTYPFGDGNQKKKSDFNSLYFVQSVRQDGADEDILDPLWAGNADNFEISDDGLTITPVEEGFGIGLNSDLGKFINSMCENGFPETNLPDDNEPINYEAIIGTRCRFVQVAQVGRDGKPMKRVAKAGKYKGKEFDQTSTQVSAVLALPGDKSSSKAGKPAKTAGKVAGPVKGKAAKADDVSDLAKETLLSILADQDDNSIAKAKIRMKIFGLFGAKHPQRAQRDAVVKYLFDDDNLTTLAESGEISYDAADKDQIISAA